MNPTPINLSVIIPVYKPDKDFSSRILHLYEFLNFTIESFEIILIDDGNCIPLQLKETSQHQNIIVFRLVKNSGKGAAIKKGMELAKGYVCLFTDHDIPYHLSGILYFYKAIGEHVDIIVGDRNLNQSFYRYAIPWKRKIANYLFSKFLTSFTLGIGQDTQCGLKAFRHDVAHELFKLMTINNFSFDLEIMYIAQKYSLTMKRAPVKLVNSGESTVSVIKDGLKMVIAIFKIFINNRKGLYKSEKLQSISNPIYWDLSA